MASRGAGEGQGAVALADLCRLVSDAVQSSGDADLAAAAAALQQPHPGDDSGRAHGSEATPAEIADDGLALFARAATQHGSLRTRLSEPDSLDLFAAVFRDAACEAQWGQVRQRCCSCSTRRHTAVAFPRPRHPDSLRHRPLKRCVLSAKTAIFARGSLRAAHRRWIGQHSWWSIPRMLKLPTPRRASCARSTLRRTNFSCERGWPRPRSRRRPARARTLR